MKNKKLIIISIVLILSLITSSSMIYYIKATEIDDLKSKHLTEETELNSQISSLEIDKESLEDEKEDLQEDINTLENNIDTLEDNIDDLKDEKEDMKEDWEDYDKLMTKGLNSYSVAFLNRGHAESDYDDAMFFYEDPADFEWVEFYASSAATYYSYSADEFRSAKSYFNQANDFAPTDKTTQLANLHVNVCDFGSQISDIMYDANTCFASACGYYSNELWSEGDSEIERMNNYLNDHDNIVSDFNNVLSEIDALVDSL